MRRFLKHARPAALAVALLTAAATPAAQSDLDVLMARVVERRDENWKKLQQYVLDERETLRIVGPDGAQILGRERHYTWFIRDGLFVRSPLRADGVTIGEGERRRQEDAWIAAQQRREALRAKCEGRPPEPTGAGDDVLLQSVEPQFVSAAYFLRFRFDPGRYALAGRDTFEGREALRIEYYPTRLFDDEEDDECDPGRRERRAERDEDRPRRLDAQMNKVSLVTLWVLTDTHQIVRYAVDNVAMGFLPGRWLVRAEEAHASMHMVEAFPDVWLPGAIDMRFRLMTAAGRVDAEYAVRYHDYRLADVRTRILP